MSRRPQDDEMINFTPEAGFTIESLAKTVIQMMHELDMDAYVNLPDGAVLEIEKECTAKEIIDGYKKFLSKKMKLRPPSNKNKKKEK